jgi:mRNA interferase YafQ
MSYQAQLSMAKPLKKAVKPAVPRIFAMHKDFRKDWSKLEHSGRYDMARLKAVMIMLIDATTPLPAEYLDHALVGNWLGHRECHIGGDWLLIYRLDIQANKDDLLMFVRTGTHSELF